MSSEMAISTLVKSEIGQDDIYMKYKALGKRTDEHDGKIIKDEAEEVVAVGGSSYSTLFKFLGGFWFISSQALILATFQGCRALLDYTLGQWSKDPDVQQQELMRYIIQIFAIALAASLLTLCKNLLSNCLSVRFSRSLHQKMMRRVLLAPINLYYDVTPIGQVLNRFSSDLSMVDDVIAMNVVNISEIIAQVFQILVVVSITNYWIIVAVPFILLTMLLLVKAVMPAWKEMFRVAQVCKSPLLSQVSEVAEGSSTIRAFNRQKEFIDDNFVYLNSLILAQQYVSGTYNWFVTRVSVIGVVMTAACSVVCIVFRFSEDPILIAMTFSYVS